MKIQNILFFLVIFAFSSLFAQNKVEKIEQLGVKGQPVVEQVKVETLKVSSTPNSTATVVTYDFTTSATKYYGGLAACKVVEINGNDTTYAMIAGDANSSGSINTTDYLVIKPDIGNTGYYQTDVNMSGSVNTTDYLIVKSNVGKVTKVP